MPSMQACLRVQGSMFNPSKGPSRCVKQSTKAQYRRSTRISASPLNQRHLNRFQHTVRSLKTVPVTIASKPKGRAPSAASVSAGRRSVGGGCSAAARAGAGPGEGPREGEAAWDLKHSRSHSHVYSAWQVARNVKLDATSAFVVLLHVAAVAVVLLQPLTAHAAAVLAGSYTLRMFVVTAGYHRYFSHRSFKTSRWFQALLAAACCCAGQRGPVWWSSMHRHHHRHSDEPSDAHSPNNGFLWSHMGWFMSAEAYNDIQEELVPDWMDQRRFPELKWLDDRHHWLFVGHALLWLGLGGVESFLWGVVVSTVLSNQVTFGINSVVHIIGSQRFVSNDESRNCWWFALLTHGEGWHNNHHAFPSSVRQGLRWWEWDFTYYVLRGLEAVGLVWDLRTPSEAAIKRKLIVQEGEQAPVPTTAAAP